MKSRIESLDNLRILLVTLVIAHHVGQAYGPTGGAWPVFNAERVAWLGSFFAVNAAFFMGLFFWIAGYFTPNAFDRKGAGRFVRDRLRRIGIPLLVYFLIISVPISYWFGSHGGPDALGIPLLGYYLRPWRWDWLTVYMHLWFLGHLLVYSLAYAALRIWRGESACNVDTGAFGHRPLIAIVLGLAGVSTLFRFGFPQDVWVFLGVPVEFAHFPQYVMMFALGIASAQLDWWRRLSRRVGYVWLAVGLLAAIVPYARLFPATSGMGGLMQSGGLDWRTAVFALWESLLCIGMSVGLLTLFREKVSWTYWWTRELSGSAYAAYIVHVPLIVVLQMASLELALSPNTKFFAVVAVAWLLTFLVAGGLRRLPGARTVL